MRTITAFTTSPFFTGELGIAVQSRTISVGSRTRSAKGGVAVVAHQASSNPMYGELGIQLIEKGMTPQQALDYIVRADPMAQQRHAQVAHQRVPMRGVARQLSPGKSMTHV